MGFHQVIHALVRNDVPIVFLDFARFVQDGEYLFKQLQPVIGSRVLHERAIAAHRRTARPDLVRTGDELSSSAPTCAPDTVARFPAFETVDRAALVRELRRAQASEQSANKMLEERARQFAASRSEV